MKATTAIIVAILAILTIIFAVLWINANDKSKDIMKNNEELKKLYETSTSTINEIQSSLESLEQDLSGQLFTQKEIPGTSPEERRTKIISSIANMRDQIEADKKKIATLEKQLATSKSQLKGVQEIVNKLKASISEKEQIMDELQQRLGILNETLETERRTSAEEIQKREMTITEKEQQITQQSIEANTIYYVYGTRKELMSKGIMDRKGGLLGIGKVSTVKQNIPVEQFTTMNLLENQQITFPATKKGYSILTNHPATSYKVEKQGDQNVLTILDATSFRKQKFVVIELL
jgi:septal ring factor EnvC (AmiA/AmiB activator)